MPGNGVIYRIVISQTSNPEAPDQKIVAVLSPWPGAYALSGGAFLGVGYIAEKFGYSPQDRHERRVTQDIVYLAELIAHGLGVQTNTDDYLDLLV